MKKFGLLSTSAMGSAALFGLSLAFAAPAQAQSTPDACAPNADGTLPAGCDAPEAADAPSEQGVVVVGSRLRRNPFNTPDPIQLITRDEAIEAGFTSAADILQSTAVTGGQGQINNTFGGFVTAGGPGANTISLRGLGTARTLVLLNGRRVAPAGSRGQVGSADLNVLPQAIIDRIEILSGGASSIYGSDAVAGVINIVTRPNPEGLSVEGQVNVPEAGGEQYRASIVYGYRGERFRIAGSLEYYRRNALSMGDVDWARCQTQRRLTGAGAAPDSGSWIDPRLGGPQCYTTGTTGESGVTVNTLGTPNIAGATVDRAPGVPAGYTGVCNRFRPDATAGGALPGFECVGGGTINVNVRDTFPGSILRNDFISPATVYTGFLQAAYQTDILGDAEIYSEFLVNRRNSSQLQNRQFTIDYRFGSPLIPVGLRFPTTFLGPQAGGMTGLDPIGVRVFADYGNYENRQTVDFVKGIVGFRGNLWGGWRYDAYVSKSWSDGTYTTDLLLIDRLTASSDVVQNPNGTFSCRQPIPGCVAQPALTAAVVNGVFPQAWFDYVTAPVTGHTAYRERVANVTIDGPLFELPGGMAQLALGVEQRRASINDQPDENSVNSNLYGFTSSTPTVGSDSVWEVFGEVEFPILSNVPLAYALTVTGSARYTDYRSSGGQETWKIGGMYAPVQWLSFRGNYGTSYRAPALFEQYLGATSGFQSQANDPCNNWDTVQPVGSPRRANCQSEVPAGFVATSSIQVNQVGGAASNLQPETSDSYNLGVVLQPRFGERFGQLSLSADYFNIKVSNGVSQLGFGTILAQCYDDPDFRAESICGFATRSTTAPFGLQVTTGYINISQSKAEGIDFVLRYVVPIGPGRFRLNAQLTKYMDRYNRNLPTDPITDNIGTVNNPEWTGTFNAAYEWNRWTVRYGLEWVDGTYSPVDYLFAAGTSQAVRDTYDFETRDYFLHNMSIRYQAERFGIIMGVRNIFDAEPPTISAGAYNRIGNSPLYSGYDPTGREFFINVSTSFR
jgi:outer membrane receptor protein involved in Fe transport